MVAPQSRHFASARYLGTDIGCAFSRDADGQESLKLRSFNDLQATPKSGRYDETTGRDEVCQHNFDRPVAEVKAYCLHDEEK
jgi:hypothetical protein